MKKRNAFIFSFRIPRRIDLSNLLWFRWCRKSESSLSIYEIKNLLPKKIFLICCYADFYLTENSRILVFFNTIWLSNEPFIECYLISLGKGFFCLYRNKRHINGCRDQECRRYSFCWFITAIVFRKFFEYWMYNYCEHLKRRKKKKREYSVLYHDQPRENQLCFTSALVQILSWEQCWRAVSRRARQSFFRCQLKKRPLSGGFKESRMLRLGRQVHIKKLETRWYADVHISTHKKRDNLKGMERWRRINKHTCCTFLLQGGVEMKFRKHCSCKEWKWIYSLVRFSQSELCRSPSENKP